MQRKVMLAVAAALAATAALLPAGPASASERTTEESQSLPIGSVPVWAAPTSAGTFLVTGTGQSALGLDAATMQDLATYANESGRDLSTLVAAHQGIHEFSGYTTRLEETRPDLFVRAGLATAGGAADYWIQLTTKPSADIVGELERLPVNTEVQYGAPASSKELEDLAYALTTSLAAHPDIIRSAGTRYDHERRVLRVQYAPVGGTQLTTLGSVFQEALTAGTIGGQLPIEVVPELDVDRVAVPEVTVQGGRNLNRVSGAAACTAGFTARRNGNRGVLTARHCPNALVFGHTPRAISRDPVQTGNNAFDLQWHRTWTGNGHTTNRQFRATCTAESCDRTVTAVANAPIGSTVCHWGRTSRYRCSSVAATNTCQAFTDGVTRCGLDVTANNVSAGGDSGGPWFFGNTARGIHSGGGTASLFTRIGRVQRHLDATVLRN